jgi:hypothetical protein
MNTRQINALLNRASEFVNWCGVYDQTERLAIAEGLDAPADCLERQVQLCLQHVDLDAESYNKGSNILEQFKILENDMYQELDEALADNRWHYH